MTSNPSAFVARISAPVKVPGLSRITKRIHKMSDVDLRMTAELVIVELRRRYIGLSGEVRLAIAGRTGAPFKEKCKRGHDQATWRRIGPDGHSRGCILCHRFTS